MAATRPLTPRHITWLKIALFIVCLIPAAWIALHVTSAVNPVEYVTHQTGTWTLNFLLITLCVTPLRIISGRNELLRFRRMLGLFAFFYVCCHFATWFGLDHLFDFGAMWHDVVKRRFITVGFIAFVLMAALAVTSNAASVRKLKRNWARLHKAIYAIAILGVVHYWWLVKRDITDPAIYAVLLAILLGWRIWRAQQQQRQAAARAR